jgi:multiple sugar transport system substrate-binding protein
MYRKTTEKSRYWDTKKIDQFLFLAAIVLAAVFAAVNLLFKNAGPFRRAELSLDRQCERLFGRDTVDALIREFENQNPEIRIRAGVGAVDSGTPPDIVFFEEGRSGSMPPQDALIALNPYMRTETGDELRAIPLVSFMDLLFYNINMLQAAGFDRPPRTQAEFLACARAVAGSQSGTPQGGATPEVYGAALGLGPEDPLGPRRDVFSWIWAAGGDLRSGSGGGRPYFGDKTAVETVAFLEELNREGALAPGTFVKTGADRIDEFAGGKFAMMIASSREIQPLRKLMGAAAFGVTAVPGSAAGKNRAGLSGIYAGISVKCGRQDEAWAFLSFLAKKGPVLAAALEAVPGSFSGVFPGASAVPGDYIQQDPLYSKAWDIFEASEIVRSFSGNSGGEEFERAVREELRVCFARNRDAAGTVSAIQKRWDALN